MKVLKRLFCFILSGIIVLSFVTSSLAGSLTVSATPYYPDGWQDWKQGNHNPWSDMKMTPGRNTIAEAGCAIMSASKMFIMAGLIEDTSYSPVDYIKWCQESGMWDENSCIQDWSTLGNYGKASGTKATGVITYEGIERITDWDKFLTRALELRNEGKLILVTVKHNNHHVLCGDPVDNGKDFECYDSGGNKDRRMSLYKDSLHSIKIYSAPNPVYPGQQITTSNTDSSTEEVLAEASQAASETQDNSFRINLNDYTKSELESIAILKNKFLTIEDLASLQWNQIVSQFVVPYSENIPEMMEKPVWQQLYDIDNLDLTGNAYYREKSTLNKSELLESTTEYLNYLKTNKINLRSMLKLFSEEDNYIYTPILTETGDGASIYNLYNDDALYIHDTITLFGDDIEEKIETNNDNKAFLDNTDGSIVTDVSGNLVTTTDNDFDTTISAETTLDQSNLIITSDTDSVWQKMNSMKTLLDGNLKSILTEVSKNAINRTTTIPVYINTDSTYAYNTLFVNNYLKINSNNNNKSQTIEEFYDNYKNLQLYLDQYGNIYFNSGSLTYKHYVLVYPAYANPLFTSTELQDNDLAGVYYEDFNKILEETNISINENNSQLLSDKYYTTNSENLYIINKDINNIITLNRSEYSSNDISLGLGNTLTDNIFQVHYLTNSKKVSTAQLRYRRTGFNGATKLDRPTYTSVYPYSKIDTTTNNIINKCVLSMLTKYEGEDKSILNGGTNTVMKQNDTDWYWDLATPNFKYIKSSIDYTNTTISDIDLAENISSSVNSSLSLEKFNTNLIYKGDVTSSQSPSIQSVADKIKIRAGDYYVVQAPYIESGNEDNSYISKSGTIDSFQYGKETLLTDIYTSSDKYQKIEYSVPMFTYIDGFKGVYNNEDFTLSGNLRKAVFYKNTANKMSNKKVNSISSIASTQGYSLSSEDTLSTDYLAENYYLMNVMDSDRFNTYFTINTDFSLKGLTGALPESIVYYFINNNSSPIYNKTNNSENKGTSIPVFGNVIDDASGWNFKVGEQSEVNIKRESEQDILVDKGLLSEVPYSMHRYITNSTYTTENSGMKLTSLVRGISSKIDDYPISDIITIAMIWDNYYLSNSPLETKIEYSEIKTGELYNNTNTIITAYNSLIESNNNELYFTKFTNNSLELGIDFKPSIYFDLTDSYFYAKQKVFSVNYNVPSFLLSIYKNGYGDNLQRWVDELESTNKAKDVMDLIDEYTSHVVTGFKNFIISICQYLHRQINGGGNASLFNITIITDTLIEQGYFRYVLIIHAISLAICFVKMSAIYIFNYKQRIQHLLTDMGKLLAISMVPILIIALFQNCFKLINEYGFKYPNTKMILNSTEKYKENSYENKEYVDTSDILLEWFKNDTNTFNEITLLFTINEDGETVEVSLQDLYKSIDYKTNLFSDGVANSFDGNQDIFGGLAGRENILWYNSEEYVAVNYNKYSASVFYYFYDWLKSQYLIYNSSSFTNYTKPDVDTLQETYLLNMIEAEKGFRKATGNFRKMYSDKNYALILDDNGDVLGVSDILGLSNLFNLTDDTGNINIQTEEDLINWAYNEDEKFNKEFYDWDEYLLQLKVTTDYKYNYRPLSKIINSDIWNYYKEGLTVKESNRNWLTILPEYYNSRIIDDNRVSNRFYGSLGLLELHTGNSKALKLEEKLNKINENVYDKISTLLSTYKDDEITDDGIIFATALFATFEFNQVFLNSNEFTPMTLNNERIDFEDIIKTIYTNKTLDNNLYYNIYYSDNSSIRSIFMIILLTVGEVLTAFALMIRLLVYVLLIGLIIIVCYYYTFVKKNRLDQIILGFFKQILVLFVGQIILLAWINLSIISIQVTSSFLVKMISALLFATIGVVSIYWYIISLVSLIKDIGQFGNNAIDNAIQTITNTANGVRGKIRTKLSDLTHADIRDSLTDEINETNKRRNQNIKIQRRLTGIDKLNDINNKGV